MATTDTPRNTPKATSGPAPEVAPSNPSAGAPRPRRRRPWLTAVKWVVGIVVGLLVVLLLGLGVAVWILTPDRLTPLVERMGSDFIDGQVKVKRVELTYWSTFPHLNLEVDSLAIISHSLRGLTEDERAQLPAGADSLLQVSGLSGGINLLHLLKGEIMLTDVVIDRPAVRLVDVRPGLSNYNIFPTDTAAADTAKAMGPLPDIALRRFLVKGDAPIRYVALSDSIDFQMTLEGIDVNSSTDGSGAPGRDYALRMNADAQSRVGNLNIGSLRLGASGDVLWNHKEPYRIQLDNFEAGVNKIRTVTSAVVNLADALTVESLTFAMPTVPVDELIAVIPAEMRGDLDKVENTLSVALEAQLLKPYRPVEDKLPTMDVKLSIPRGTITYDRMTLEALELAASAHVDGDRPEASTVTIERLFAAGEGVGVELSATATDIFADPLIEGTFKGGVRFEKLPRQLLQTYDIDASGRLVADAGFWLRQSDLDRANFHRMKLTGEAKLLDFNLSWPMLPLEFYTRQTELDFGTASKFVRDDISVDSLLTASLKIDTLHCAMQGMDVRGARWRVGVGMRNLPTSTDTTQINPIGAVLSMDRVRFRNVSMDNPGDTLRLNLRKMQAHASVKRYKDLKRAPLVSLSASIGRLRLRDNLNRVTLRDAETRLRVHPQAPRMNRRIRASLDSLRQRHPNWPLDSVYRMAVRLNPPRARKNAVNATTPANAETLDFALDSTTTNLLRSWRLDGSFKARRGRLLTPLFPLKNVMTDLDMTFNNDSVDLRNVRLQSGRSDFTIHGTIGNIQRSLTSKGLSPLELNLQSASDTIDVNELTAAAFAGAAFQARLSGDTALANQLLAISDDDDNDDKVNRTIAAAVDTADSGPLLMPVNVRARCDLRSKVILYDNFVLDNMHCEAALFDGALNLRDLSAHSAIGSLNLTALYEGLDPSALRFTFGMKVDKFLVREFMSLMPSLDTIMPLMQDIDGIIDADVAAATRLDSMMNFIIPSLEASVTIHGDSLVLMDAETFRKIGKWLLFKNKEKNVVDSMTVKLTVHDGMLNLYPFIFNIDRYKLGVFGSNDLNLNYKYHVAVLKSPIPFKFGINVSGNPDKMKIRLGGAKLNEKTMGATVAIADTTRINLINQIESVFRRGLRNAQRAGRSGISMQRPARLPSLDESASDTISASDSLFFMDQGLIARPDTLRPGPPVQAPPADKKAKKKKK